MADNKPGKAQSPKPEPGDVKDIEKEKVKSESDKRGQPTPRPSGGQGKSTQGANFLKEIKTGTDLVLIKSKKNAHQKHFVLGEEYLSYYKDANEMNKLQQGRSPGPSLLCGLGASSHPKQFYTFDFKEIRDGAMSDVFDTVLKKQKVQGELCFSIVYGAIPTTLDLVAPDRATQQAWVKGLRHLLKKRTGADLISKQDLWLREMFRNADKNGDKVLSIKEVRKLMKNLNICIDEHGVKQAVKIAHPDSSDRKDSLDLDEFMNFYQLITKRSELEGLFTTYSSDEGRTWDEEDMKTFFDNEQNVKMEKLFGKDIFKKLITEYEPSPDNKSKNRMTLGGFSAMVNAPVKVRKSQSSYQRTFPVFGIFHPAASSVYQSMSEPLSHYFINSSHNTYLTAGQLYGDSSIEAYIRALKMGSKCVELDCWDGDPEPVIYHGHTLTSKILFKDAIEAINKYAFYISDYPVILSLENHCSVDQQKLMAKHMKHIFGKKLFTTALPPSQTCLPSPDDLRGKIVVKAKRLPESETDRKDDDDDDDYDEEPDEIKAQHKEHEHKKKEDISKELSDCVVICRATKFKEFHNQTTQRFEYMSSFGENKAHGLIADSIKAWIEHNRWQLSRVYPKALRTDSSNYDPMPMWCAGNQIVALNFQTADNAMLSNQGKFEDNGKCGYLLKPEFLRNGSDWDPNSSIQSKKSQTKFTIKLISGFQLPKKHKHESNSILDPYVVVSIQGIPKDEVSQQTPTVKNNGFHPLWDTTMEFNVTCPQMALVHFRVMDAEGSFSSDELVAQFCLPYTAIQKGYRTVHLKNEQDDYIWGATLFVRVITT